VALTGEKISGVHTQPSLRAGVEFPDCAVVRPRGTEGKGRATNPFQIRMIDFARMWQPIRTWLQSWGNLLVAVAIAGAAYLQWHIYRGLLRLEKKIDDDQSRVEVRATVFMHGDVLSFTIANLCRFGIWLDKIEVTVAGETKVEPFERMVLEPYKELPRLPIAETFRVKVGRDRDQPASELVTVVARCRANGKDFTCVDRAKVDVSWVHGVPRWHLSRS
jgi:hypothetical protein